MKIGIFLGYRGTCGQVQRIEEGWINNGNLIFEGSEDQSLDLIYANDSGEYDKAILLKNKYPNAKLILNVLDIPKKYHPSLDLENLKFKLKKADFITSISKYVKNQIQEYLDLNSIIIHNPIKNINKQNLDRDVDFLYVGRLWEPSKRFNLSAKALSLLNIRANQFFIIGPDNPGQNLNYLGEVDDFTLNMLYNRSKILMFTTEYEGLGLPAVEAVICGCIPIICKDNPTAEEFGLKDFMVESNPNAIAERILNLKLKDFESKINTLSKELYSLLNKEKIAKNIEDIIC